MSFWRIVFDHNPGGKVSYFGPFERDQAEKLVRMLENSGRVVCRLDNISAKRMHEEIQDNFMEVAV